jgi:hypothetical protein
MMSNMKLRFQFSSLKTLALFSLLAILSKSGFAQSGGQGFFSSNINWSQTPDLYYQVVAAPPSTCGDLVITRNGGSPLTTPNWLCTDGNGSATKGPWTWAKQSGDELAVHAYIRWPDGRQTTEAWHVWDKTCPLMSPNQAFGYTSTFSGTAADGINGAGFTSAWTVVKLTYFNRDSLSYWDPSTDTYSLSTPPDIYATLTGLGSLPNSPSYSMTWSGTVAAHQVPSYGAHNPSSHYTWAAHLLDGDNRCSSVYSTRFPFQ